MSVPVYFPLLALLPIISSLIITSWLFSENIGYILTGALLVSISAYGLLHPEIRLQFDAAFLLLIGGYWLGLLAHYYHNPHAEILLYIAATPVAVFATVFVLPTLIIGRRQIFAMGLTLIAVALTAVGLAMVWQETQTSHTLYDTVGGTVMGIDGIRTPSIFSNPNGYGFVMMVGTLTALYTYFARRGVVWFGVLLLCLGGLVLSEGDAALLGFTAGSVLVLSGSDRRFGFLGLVVAILGVYVAIRLGHVGDVMETTLLTRVDRWVASLERLALDPMFGIGFADTAEEIGEARGPHNSYIYPILNTGIIAGGLYLGSFVYALGQGIRKRWTLWNAYVVGLSVGIFCYMGFESLFLGGFSISSIMLGLCLGLLLYSPEADGPVTDIRSKFTIR
ncbi:O-antigen ligase domain-containing protein [Natronococcus jeotgali]|nr:O-antigen ligase domain-containing protein [Natronococcus jeotgali]